MYKEDELLPISALQHLAFCERQWGLIYIEQIWNENRLTMEGKAMHERVDAGQTENHGDVIISRGVRLRSLRLGLSGIADVIEFHHLTETEDGIRAGGIILDNTPGLWQVFPVEYKHGRPKSNNCDKIQLCAQALCFEEMRSVTIPEGALFYGQSRKRLSVIFDTALRDQTTTLVTRLHQLTEKQITPRGTYSAKCRSCSLMSFCLPHVVTKSRSARRYVAGALNKLVDDERTDGN